MGFTGRLAVDDGHNSSLVFMYSLAQPAQRYLGTLGLLNNMIILKRQMFPRCEVSRTLAYASPGGHEIAAKWQECPAA